MFNFLALSVDNCCLLESSRPSAYSTLIPRSSYSNPQYTSVLRTLYPYLPLRSPLSPRRPDNLPPRNIPRSQDRIYRPKCASHPRLANLMIIRRCVQRSKHHSDARVTYVMARLRFTDGTPVHRVSNAVRTTCSGAFASSRLDVDFCTRCPSPDDCQIRNR